jgi:hypothetical protein
MFAVSPESVVDSLSLPFLGATVSNARILPAWASVRDLDKAT